MHEVARAASPQARVVYVDNDPMVLAHARALLTPAARGAPRYVQADLRSPGGHPVRARGPVAARLHRAGGAAAARGAALPGRRGQAGGGAAALLDALPSGSYLAASHLTPEHDPAGVGGAQRAFLDAGLGLHPRDADEFAALVFSGLDLVPPGVVLVSEWRPDSTGPRPVPAEVSCYGGVARKP